MEDDTPLPDPDAFRPPPRPGGFLTSREAAVRAGTTPQAITGWCRAEPGLGVRAGTHRRAPWLIDAAAFAALLRPRAGGGDAAG